MRRTLRNAAVLSAFAALVLTACGESGDSSVQSPEGKGKGAGKPAGNGMTTVAIKPPTCEYRNDESHPNNWDETANSEANFLDLDTGKQYSKKDPSIMNDEDEKVPASEQAGAEKNAELVYKCMAPDGKEEIDGLSIEEKGSYYGIAFADKVPTLKDCQDQSFARTKGFKFEEDAIANAKDASVAFAAYCFRTTGGDIFYLRFDSVKEVTAQKKWVNYVPAGSEHERYFDRVELQKDGKPVLSKNGKQLYGPVYKNWNENSHKDSEYTVSYKRLGSTAGKS